jgi:hypothetical protein
VPNHYPITIELDCPEPRVLLDRLIVTAGGSADKAAWAGQLGSNVWRPPGSGRVMLAPLPLTPTWRTATTGSYARLRKTDYTLTTGAAWVENHRDIPGNVYLEGNGTNERVRTTATYGADQAMFLSLYVPGIESLGEQSILECGWGVPGASGTISLRFRANGQVSLWKGTTQLDVGDADYSDKSSKALDSMAAKTVNILLLPMRPAELNGDNRGYGELSVTTSIGNSVVFKLAGLGLSDPIVPSGYFWWQVPYGRPSVQLAPCKFATAGSCFGPAQTLRYPPSSPRTFAFTNYYGRVGGGTPAAVASLVKSSDLSAYSPDGTTTGVRMKVAFEGDGTSTIYLDAVDAVCERTTTTTADEPIDITCALQEPEIRMGDDRKCSVVLKGRLKTLEALGIPKLLETGDRPYRIYLTREDDLQIDLIRGTLAKPVVSVEGDPGNLADMVTWTGRDRSEEFDYYTFAESIADDGQVFTNAIKRHIECAGFERTTDIATSTSAATLPFSPNIETGEWSRLPARNSALVSAIDTLFDSFAADWWRMWAPTLTGYRYLAYAPGDLSTVADTYLYVDRADALAAGVPENFVGARTLLDGGEIHRIPAEANQIIVVGQDPVTGQLIYAQSNYTAGQTPGTAPSSRPASWRGRLHRVQVIEPGITTQALADSANSTLSTRLLSERYIRDFSLTLIVRPDNARPIWAGDVVRIYAKGRATWEEYRIVSIPSIKFLREFSVAETLAGAVPVRRVTYRGERIAVGP